jgi:hypothetical protein
MTSFLKDLKTHKEPMYISGTADDRWDDDVLNTLKQIKNTDFEVVKMGRLTTQ